MGRIATVLKQKRNIDNEIRNRKRSEIQRLKKINSVKYITMDLLSKIDIILEDKDVDAVVIHVDDKQLGDFSRLLMEPDINAGYIIKQVKNEVNEFEVRKRYVAF